jgi:hypothetical protein
MPSSSIPWLAVLWSRKFCANWSGYG